MATEKLDVRGRACPVPLLMTKRKLESMQEGEVLEVLSDFPQTRNNIQSLVERTGSQTLGVKEQRGAFKILIKKGPAKVWHTAKENDLSCLLDTEKR
jgi:tRNA 2-thiouridine synthesizing protein A